MRTALEHEVTRLVEEVLRLDEPDVPPGAVEGLLDHAAAGTRGARAAASLALEACVAPRQGTRLAAPISGLDAMQAFEAAASTPAGKATTVLVVLAEVVLRAGPQDPPGPPQREHLVALAERCGWRLDTADDRTPAMLHFRDALIASIERRRSALRRAGFEVDAALASLRLRSDGLRRGDRRGEMLVFERSAGADATVVSMNVLRAAAMQRLFVTVFGHSMSTEHRRWKYERGRARAVALERDGELLAHYGGLTRELRVFGRPALGCQICDVMVQPSANGSLARRGPMHRVAASFLEREIGWGTPHEFGFGFPNARHHRLADRLGLYAAVDRVVQLAWPPAAPELAAPWRLEPLARGQAPLSARQLRAVDRLWHSMAAAMTDVALGVRDGNWVQWRYVERPGIEYELHLVRRAWTTAPIGLIVTRRRDDALELIDLVAPPSRFDALVGVARALAGAAGLPELRCWITASQQHRLSAIEPAPRIDDLEIEVPANRHTAGNDPAALENRWFLLAGDADFT